MVDVSEEERYRDEGALWRELYTRLGRLWCCGWMTIVKAMA